MLGDGVEVFFYSFIEGVLVVVGCLIGFFVCLCLGVQFVEQVKIGNFVEVKKFFFGLGIKVSYFVYFGDVMIGVGINIGVGMIICNYDGENKYVIEIGDGVFIGSDMMFVVLVQIGDCVMMVVGLMVMQNVFEGSLVVGCVCQKNIVGWVECKV